MTKVKDNSNIAKVIGDLTGQKPEIITDDKERFNYLIPQVQRLYNLINPQQTTIQNTGIIFYNSNEEYDDNAYYAQVGDYYRSASPAFSNLIDLRRNMLIGEGLIPVNAGDQQVLEFLNRENEYGETLGGEIWNKICFDFSLFESYALELLYSPKDNGSIQSVIHHGIDVVRAVQNVNLNLNYVNQYELSRNWAKTNQMGRNSRQATRGIPIAAYNHRTWAQDGARQLLVCKRYTTGNQVYATPSFNSILGYVELDSQLARYSLSTVSKGFTPTSIVTLPGAPDAKSKNEFILKFKNRYTGADGERVLFLWTTDQTQKATIDNFNTTDITPLLEAMVRITTEKICAGMGASLELVAGSTAGASLQTDMNKLSVAYNFFYMTKILPMQKQMIGSINIMLKNQGLGPVTVVTPPLKLETPQAQTAPVQPTNQNNIN